MATNIYKRSRPLILTLLCVYSLAITLQTAAPLLALILDLAKEFQTGGWMQLRSAYRATCKPEHLKSLAEVTFTLISLGGMWCVKLWGVIVFSSISAWHLGRMILAGNFYPLGLAINALCTFGPWIGYVSSSVQLAKRLYVPPADDAPIVPNLAAEISDGSRRNPVNELIY